MRLPRLNQRVSFLIGKRLATGEIYDIIPPRRNEAGIELCAKLAVTVMRGDKATNYSIDADDCEHIGRFATLKEAKAAGWQVECRNEGPSDWVHYSADITHPDVGHDYKVDPDASWSIQQARRWALARINEMEEGKAIIENLQAREAGTP